MKLNWFPNFYLWKTSLRLDGRILNNVFKCSCQYAISNFHSYSFHVIQWSHHPSMMSHSGKFIENVHTYSFNWCHHPYSFMFTHILSCIVMSSSFNDVTFWKVYLESSNIFFHVLWCHHPSMMSHTGKFI